MNKSIDFDIEDLEPDFLVKEKSIREYWKQNRIFEKSVDRPDADKFVIYDGPPFATGLPHYGHLITHTIKDVIPRYQTMKGKKVERRFGWDCHGLPVEFLVEKELGLSGNDAIKNFGIAKFNEKCRSIVLRHMDDWKETEELLGRWVDMENDYKTMDSRYIESVWWVFKQLFEKGLIYEGKKIVAYSTSLASPLSNFEANLNYKNIEDPAITLSFELTNSNEKILVWTTTPWTLPSNVALAIDPNIDYLKVKLDGEIIILAKESPILLEKQYEVISEFKGQELIGKSYKPIFDYFTDLESKGAFKIISGKNISTKKGTGVVHIAPAYSEDDYDLAKNNNLEIIDPIDSNGKFTSQVADLAGLGFRESNSKIIKLLKQKGVLYKHDKISHSHPHCWRSNTPLMFKAVPSWYVSVSKIKDKLIENNQEITWSPSHLKDGRFGNWISDARDWAISRNRFWGAPIPIWKCDETGEILCIGSQREMEEQTGKSVKDLHRDAIDELIINREGKEFRRTPEVLDCWFESGSMPYAQAHYPFENKDWFAENFPADFIAEGIDQTRGWFYTLLVISTALFDKPAFKSAIVNGTILAEDGRKMSKNLKNYPDPKDILEKFGADALRFYLMDSKAAKGSEMRFSEDKVDLTVKQILLPLWHVFKFFITYANANNWHPADELRDDINNPETAQTNIMDKWILALLEKTHLDISNGFEENNLTKVTQNIASFIDNLSRWYVRLNRSRYWKSKDESDKNLAFNTLYQVLTRFSQIISPIMPYISETIYRSLSGQESVHLSSWPNSNINQTSSQLIEEMNSVVKIVECAHALRNQKNIRIRQPLATLFISNTIKISDINPYIEIFKKELNVKEVKCMDDSLITSTVLPDNIIKQASGEIIAIDSDISSDLREEGAIRDLTRFVQKLRKESNFKVSDKIELSINGANDLVHKYKNLILNTLLVDEVSNEMETPEVSREIYLLNVLVKINMRRTVGVDI